MAGQLTTKDALAAIGKAKTYADDNLHITEPTPEAELIATLVAVLERMTLDVAMREAKLAAGLAPNEPHLPMLYIDHLPAELHYIFWTDLSDRALDEMVLAELAPAELTSSLNGA